MMRMPTRAQGTSKSWCEEGDTSVITLVPLFHTQHTSQEECLQPVTEDSIGKKPWLVTIHISLSMTITRPNVIAALLERSPAGHIFCRWQLGRTSLSWRTHWWRWLCDRECYESCVHHNDHIWVHPEPEHPVSLWCSSGFEALCAMSGPRRGVIMASLGMMISLHRMASNEVIMVWSERMVTAWLKGLLEAINSLTEPNFQISHWEGLYIARTLFQAWWERPVRIRNVSSWDQVLNEGMALGCCEEVTWAVSVNGLETQTPGTQRLCQQLKEIFNHVCRKREAVSTEAVWKGHT